MAKYAQFEQDGVKLAEAAIYLSQLSVDDPNFGMPKLVKLLYYSDCAAYAKYGQPITGTTYLHFPHGPFPENWHRVRAQMEAKGDVAVIYETAAPGYHRYRMFPRRAANLELLSPDDRTILEEQAQRFAGFNAAGIEQYSHQEVSWLSTEDGEAMAYELAGIVSVPLSEREMRAVSGDLPL